MRRFVPSAASYMALRAAIRYDHYALDAATYPSPLTNFRTNLHRSWVVDNDKFSTNQFLHPYQGSVYQGLARSAGLSFWGATNGLER